MQRLPYSGTGRILTFTTQNQLKSQKSYNKTGKLKETEELTLVLSVHLDVVVPALTWDMHIHQRAQNQLQLIPRQRWE